MKMNQVSGNKFLREMSVAMWYEFDCEVYDHVEFKDFIISRTYDETLVINDQLYIYFNEDDNQVTIINKKKNEFRFIDCSIYKKIELAIRLYKIIQAFIAENTLTNL